MCWPPKWEVGGLRKLHSSSELRRRARAQESPPALAGSSHCSMRETLERFVGVQSGKVPHIVVVGAATSPQRRGGRSLRA